ncbi:MAG: AraC family transcriptional regulator [Lentisphaeria bacterium]
MQYPTDTKTLRQRLQTVIDNIGQHTPYGAIYYNFRDSHDLMVGRGVCRFCSQCAQQSKTAPFCRNSACSAAVQGHAIGDSWYFRCWLGIDSIAVPLAPAGDVIGALEIGGFFSPGGTREAQQNILSRLSSIAADNSFEIMTRSMQGIRELNFKEVKAISQFALEATFAEGLNDDSAFAVRHQIYNQQERLAATIGKLQLREEETELRQKMFSLARLIEQIHTGDRHTVLVALDDFLGKALLDAGGDENIVKANILLLAGTLFQELIQQGANWNSHIHEYEQQLANIGKYQNVEDLCFWAERIVLEQYEYSRKRQPERSATTPLSERLLAWMRINYRRKLTIADATREIGASTSAITHSIKEQTGKTFATHLNGIRISEAKRLLAYSNLTLAEISYRAGFQDQSYFTKVFRKTVNLTPSRFRDMLDNREC